MSAISDSSAFFMFLFFIFDLPDLSMFGILSIPLLIIFLPISDPIAFEPKLIPAFKKFCPIPLPICGELSG